ncbi:protein phosphatase 2C domain-containing protein [Sphingomonas sp. PAMC 26605]|uniref:protein phosphatase 2C domain-containing protein n=1 Tax=Sphingomonas sp. PAMC 26605 TaxID=1112214 RepID=UPI00026CDDC6|nr:protein phosphatase 2C domain-containing protein [Sphingomonas sp. PAMC 26605]
MLHFDLIQSISLAGNAAAANDDRAGAGARRAWVIDGATDLGPPGLVGAQGGAAWIAATADHAFAAASDGRVSGVVAGVFSALADAYQRARHREPVGRWELPSAAFLCVALKQRRIEIAWLADCACLHLRGDTVRRLGPQPSLAETQEAEAIRSAGLDLLPMRSAPTLDRLRTNRTRGERRVLGVEPGHTDAVHYDTAAIAPGDELVLMTDGLAALIDDYGVPIDAFAPLLRAEGLHGVAARLRAIEADDADCRRFARFKPSDDATGLWLRITGEA